MASTKPEGVMMLVLTDNEEVKEVRLALAARQRATGSGTERHDLCTRILAKMDDAERKPASNVAGFDLRDRPEY